MGKFVLQLKHWQVFLILTGLPILIYILLLLVITPLPVNNSGHEVQEVDPEWAMNFMEGMMALTVVFSLIVFLWFRGMISGLLQLLETHENRPSKMKLNLAFGFSLLYVMLLTGGIYYWILGLMRMEYEPAHHQVMLAISVILPLHFIAIFSILYLMYQMAKMIRLAEGKPAQRFSDFAGEFFMIWFHPIGIWFLQPRLNALISGNNEYDRHLEN